MTTTLNDQLRLEILATTSGNAIANHSGQGGTTTGWALVGPVYGGEALAAVSGLAFGYGGKALRVTSTNVGYGTPKRYDFQTVRAPEFAVVGLQYANVAVTLRSARALDAQLYLRWYNASGVEIGQPAIKILTGGAVPANTDTTITMDALFSGSLQAPSGTVKAQLDVQVYDYANQPYGISAQQAHLFQLMCVTGTSPSSVANPVFSDVPETWQNLLPKALSARVTRGGDVDGVTDALEAGTMTATVMDPLVTPNTNDRVRPGRPIRLMALNGSTWEPIFRGKIVQASTSYAEDLPIVSITATDAMADLANFPQGLGKSGTFKQRINSALLNVPVTSSVTDAAVDVAQATISADTQGTALSQLEAVRDSLRGLFYVDRFNVLRAYANASYPSQAPTITLSDTYADAGAIYYTGIETTFDSKNLVNSLLVTKNALSEKDGTTTYGPYVNQASVDAWGPISATLEVNDGTPSTLAAAYLAVYAQPTIFTESVTFNATANVAKAISRELYEAARVKFGSAGLNAVYRVIGIDHTITPDRWIVTLRFKPLESTSSITVTNPPGGPNSGPKDLAPFTREVQNGERTITTTANNVAVAGAVTFPKPYESAPRVFATARSSTPGTRVGEVTALNITTTGCDLFASSPSNPGAVIVQWHAEPAS